MKQITSKVLCKDMKGVGITESFAVGTCDGLSIQIMGDATTFKAEFECSLDSINFFKIEGCFSADQSSFATFTANTNEIISFDVGTVAHFRVKLTANDSAQGVSILAVNFID